MSVFAEAKVMLANGNAAAPAYEHISQPCMMHIVVIILAAQVLNRISTSLKNQSDTFNNIRLYS